MSEETQFQIGENAIAEQIRKALELPPFKYVQAVEDALIQLCVADDRILEIDPEEGRGQVLSADGATEFTFTIGITITKH